MTTSAGPFCRRWYYWTSLYIALSAIWLAVSEVLLPAVGEGFRRSVGPARRWPGRCRWIRVSRRFIGTSPGYLDFERVCGRHGVPAVIVGEAGDDTVGLLVDQRQGHPQRIGAGIGVGTGAGIEIVLPSAAVNVKPMLMWTSGMRSTGLIAVRLEMTPRRMKSAPTFFDALIAASGRCGNAPRSPPARSVP